MDKKIISSLLASFLATTTGLLAQEIPQPTGKIIYVDTTETNKNYIASMNADGTKKQRLTPAFFNLAFPRYCKKSGWIGFTSRTISKNKNNFDYEIYLISKNKVRRAIKGASLEDFSPDGKRMIYIKMDGKSELYVYNFAEKRAVKISGDYKVVSARWSEDGEWIVATVVNDDNSTDMVLISTKAKGFKRLTKTPGVNEGFPNFIDNSILIYSSNNNEQKEYRIEMLDIEEPSKPLITMAKGVFPCIAPDKSYFVYENDGYIMRALNAGRNKVQLAKGRAPIWVEKYEVESSSKNKKSPSKK